MCITTCRLCTQWPTSCLELLFPHQRSTHTSIGTTSFKDRSNLGVMAILNAQGKGQPPFNYYSLHASNNGFIEGLEGLYWRSALLLHANTAQRERGDGGQQGGHGSRWGGRRQPGTGDEVGHLLRRCQGSRLGSSV